MSGVPFFPQTITSQHSAGTLFNTYTTAKTVLNQENLVTLPPNFLRVGSALKFDIFGAISNVVTAQPTFTFQIMMGTIAVWSSGAIATNATANTLLPFTLKGKLRCDSVGAGTAAKMIGGLALSGAAFSTSGIVPVASPAVGTGFDSTIANVLDFFVAIQTSNAGNGVQIYDFDAVHTWS